MNEIPLLAEELRNQREELGLSTDDVFRELRIPAAYVEALERGELHELPAPCYAIGFVKTYCDFLELDPQPFIDRVRAASYPACGLFRLQRASPYARPSRLSDLVTWATVSAIILLGWLAYTAVVRPKAEVTDGRVEAGVVEKETAPPPRPFAL